MIHLLAVIAFALAVVFFAWNIRHGVWSWQFFMLWGLLLSTLAGHEKWPW